MDGRGNRYIVTMLDVYSRYLIASPVRNHKASTVSRCLYESVVAYFGAPRSILSDRGAEFTGMVWESLTQMLGAKIKLTSPYYPQGNSVIERSHRTLSNMLRTMLLEKKGRDWSSLLPSVMFYMNSMVQEKTGVSACETLFGNNPNLPSDISYTPVTSLSNDREGYVKQLKRALTDIRQKLSQILGQDKDQSKNPFSIGDKVVIAILPHENTNKLMAKWKGPFLVTKIPDRFQIEYLDGDTTRLTHINYAKRYNERCHYAEPVGMPYPTKVSYRKPWVRMARIRLVAGSGDRRTRMVVKSAKDILEKWPVRSGCIRVKVLGEREELPADLLAVIDTTGQDGWIEGRVLVDLCVQRSGQRGSGRDAPNASEKPLMPEETSLTPPTLPAVQVRQYSYHSCAKNNTGNIRLEFVGPDKQSNYVSSVLSQQAPPVAKVHLMDVVRKVGRSERSKGKQQKDGIFKAPPLRREKHITSLLHSGRKAERESKRVSTIGDYNNSGIKPIKRISYKTNDLYTLKLAKGRKKEKEIRFKNPGSMNYDVMISDVIVTGTDDVVTGGDVNKLIARKRYTLTKHTKAQLKRFCDNSLSITSQIFTKMVLIIAITITILGGMLNIIRPERKNVLGISSCSSRSSEFAKSRARNHCHGYAEPEFARDILAGKRSHAYIFPSADLWASCLYYFNIYIVNLESDHSFTIFYKLIYLYIYNVYRSWASCNWATYPEVISVNICTLVYFSSNLISLLTKSHDEYQSLILIGLARAEKANSRNRSILVHYL